MESIDLTLVDIARELLLTTLMVAGPVLVVGLLVGVSVSLFQALTSVQEQTMSLVPKMLAVMVVTLVLLAPALRLLSDFTTRILGRLVEFGLS
ncbi:MAG: flagellar biosynthetic protein FliQ [Planctomycetota bacterium]